MNLNYKLNEFCICFVSTNLFKKNLLTVMTFIFFKMPHYFQNVNILCNPFVGSCVFATKWNWGKMCSVVQRTQLQQASLGTTIDRT